MAQRGDKPTSAPPPTTLSASGPIDWLNVRSWIGVVGTILAVLVNLPTALYNMHNMAIQANPVIKVSCKQVDSHASTFKPNTTALFSIPGHEIFKVLPSFKPEDYDNNVPGSIAQDCTVTNLGPLTVEGIRIQLSAHLSGTNNPLAQIGGPNDIDMVTTVPHQGNPVDSAAWTIAPNASEEFALVNYFPVIMWATIDPDIVVTIPPSTTPQTAELIIDQQLPLLFASPAPPKSRKASTNHPKTIDIQLWPPR